MKHVATARSLSFLDSWLAYRARHVDIPGFSVSVLVDDAIVFSRAYGLANVERKTPLTTRHLFHVASQTKMLTAIAIVQFVQSGQLLLDEPVCKYLPWLKKHRDKRFQAITIRHLLSHSAGLLRDGLDCDYWLFMRPHPTERELQKSILAIDLTFEPGEGLKYSNLGYGLLGLIIEAVSDRPYASYIKQTIIEPLGIDGVALDYTVELQHRVPLGYGLPFEHCRKVIGPRLPARSLTSATGLYATPEAMCRIAAAMFSGNNTLLDDKMKTMMRRKQHKVLNGYDKGASFGLGYDFQKVGSRRVVGHSGHVGGHLTATYFDPSARLAVSVSCNAKDAPSMIMARGILGVIDFFKASDSRREEYAAFDVRLRNEMSTVQIVHNQDGLVAIDPDDWEPFSWYESLEIVNSSILRITTPGSIYNEGETIAYHFEGDGVKQVRFAGLPLWPVGSYRPQ